MADSHLISWLHLSDLHLEARENDPTRPTRDHERCLGALETDIASFVANAGIEKAVGVPDLIIASGDIVRVGADTLMFDAGWDWLSRFSDVCGVSADRIFVVPGNHDIDRTLVGDTGLLDLSSCDTPSFRGAVDNIWDSRATIAALDDKFGNYHQFADRCANVTRLALGAWRTHIVIRDVSLDIIGVNSVWTGGTDALDKPGFPVVGQTQREMLDEVGAPSERADVTLVLQHNPTSYLNSIDSLQHANWLDQKDAVVLCGHLHQSAMAERRSMQGRHLELMGGALYAGFAHGRRYSMGTVKVVPDRRRFAVALRASDPGTETRFHRDTHRYPGARDGVARFEQSVTEAILGQHPPARDQLEIELERAFLRYDGTQYHIHIEKTYRNPTDRVWTHVDALVLVNAFPDEPLRSRALYREHPLELEEIGFTARCDGRPIEWLVVHDLDSSKELQLIVGDGSVDSPGIRPGLSAVLDYRFSVDRKYWGPYFERHIRRPTARLECEIALPKGVVTDVSLVANRTITSRDMTADLVAVEGDTWDVWRWAKQEPRLQSRFRFTWEFDE